MLSSFCRVILSWFFRRLLNQNIVGRRGGFDWGVIVDEAVSRRICQGSFRFRIARGWIRLDRCRRCLNGLLLFLVRLRPHFQVSPPIRASTTHLMIHVQLPSSAKGLNYSKRTEIFATRISLLFSTKIYDVVVTVTDIFGLCAGVSIWGHPATGRRPADF